MCGRAGVPATERRLALAAAVLGYGAVVHVVQLALGGSDPYLVLPSADEGSDMTCRFYLGNGEMTIVVSVRSSEATPPDPEGFAWQVLATLADEATSSVGDGRFDIALSMHSGLRDVQG